MNYGEVTFGRETVAAGIRRAEKRPLWYLPGGSIFPSASSVVPPPVAWLSEFF
jgi:hypothetical protein